MTHGDISVPTGVNGVILPSLTSILINIPLIRTMTREAAFRRRAFGSLLLVAAEVEVEVGSVVSAVMFHALKALSRGSSPLGERGWFGA